MLSSLNSLKTFLGIAAGDASEDGPLAGYLIGADAAIKAYLHRPNLDSVQSFTEYYDGNNTNLLVLRQRPVVSVTSVYVDSAAAYGEATGAFDSTTLLVAGTDYTLKIDQPDGTSRCGILVRLASIWMPGFYRIRGLITHAVGPSYGTIKVAYSAGFSTVPADLELACNMVAARIRQGSQWGGTVAGQSYQGFSYSASDGAQGGLITKEIKMLLAQYRSLTSGNLL